ncbi:response regulator [Hyalangium rubrum]|uniref:Response regulator n=1 Tax=Hyalangium rubrum TaxID=3103134 RepID=A0ABU5HDR7_9BACT|nr:response regulator [Hyalangium sp. s54d21]MDY7230245.1 response regulator [Hyalangium sp. s54d21]
MRRTKRILIIDDSEAIHRDFRRVLCPEPKANTHLLDQLEGALFGSAPASSAGGKEEAFEVESAFQGEEGLDKVRQAEDSGQPYALVFLDYRMPPGWNGVETLRHLRQVAPGLQVVLCSAYSDYSWEEILREFGEARRLQEMRKPFSSQKLREMAAELTGVSAASAP